MPLVSAGLLMYRLGQSGLEVLLAHPGGPFFARKDRGAWTVPKGLAEPGEELQATAIREFKEEIGLPVASALLELGSVRQRSGKVVHVWAFEGDAPDQFVPPSNACETIWPPGSNQVQRFPEIDQACFFGLDLAVEKIIAAQAAFLDRLQERLR